MSKHNLKGGAKPAPFGSPPETWHAARRLWATTFTVVQRGHLRYVVLNGVDALRDDADPEHLCEADRVAAGWVKAGEKLWSCPPLVCNAAAQALADATDALLPLARTLMIDLTARAKLRELASALRNARRPTIPLLGLVIEAEPLIDEMGDRRKVRGRQGNRDDSHDARATALLRLWSDPSSNHYLPGWTVAVIAKELGVQPSVLSGKQRDGTPRCPEFMKLRQKLGRGPLSRRRRNT